MSHGAWYRYLESVTGLDMISGHKGKVRRFRPGLDYTVAHYGVFTERSVLDGTLCFVKGKGGQTGVPGAGGTKTTRFGRGGRWGDSRLGRRVFWGALRGVKLKR